MFSNKTTLKDLKAEYAETCSMLPAPREPGKIPLVSSPHYDMFSGAKISHPIYVMNRRSEILTAICDHFKIGFSEIYSPISFSQSSLLDVHNPDYLQSLSSSKVISEIMEIPELESYDITKLEELLLEPIKAGVGGTLQAARISESFMAGINLSGGFHHANRSNGHGGCFYNDVNLAVDFYLKEHPDNNVLIIDLDAHRSDGISEYAHKNPRIRMIDVYDETIFPIKQFKKQIAPVEYDIGINKDVNDIDYLRLIHGALESAIKESKPDRIYYIAGTDIHKKDPLTSLEISSDGIIMRDLLVFNFALKNHIPICSVLGGGYGKQTVRVTSRSYIEILSPFVARMRGEVFE